MRDHSKHVECSRDEAIETLLAHANFEPAVETIPLAEACGRVLAQDALAQLDMPNCLTCRLDSVAVHWSDFEDGMPDTTGWERGNQWQFANTGIGMPVGFDTAVVIENVKLSDDLSTIEFLAPPSKQYAGTTPKGAKMHAGDVLCEAGSVLTPLLVANIGSGNNTHVQVLAKPKVAFIPTGNELVPVGSELERGRNIETNSLLISSKIVEWGGEPIVMDIVPDDQEAIKETVKKACAIADIVVLNAGSSKGSDDWNVEMLDEIGEVLYHQTNHGPGHHSSGSVVDGTVVVGISGPPGGAAFTTDFYLYPVMMKYLGQDTKTQCVHARLASPFPPSSHSSKKPDKGEERPDIVKPKKEFFGVKQLLVKASPDGILEAYPASSSHPKPPEATGMSGYYLMSNLVDTPQVGDVIAIELRPEKGL